ncbi:MAG: chromosomal replication initiator protein DnaA [bacterium]|nr:chromosomal replication initiator protein DnaA [bacterium]
MEKPLKEIWQSVLAQVKLSISSANFSTWFKNTDIDLIDSGKVVISVPNNFSKDWLENKYYKNILKILRELDPNVKDLVFVVKKIGAKTSEASIFIKKEKQLDFNNLITNKETNLNNRYRFDNFIVGSFNEVAHAAATAVAEKPGSTYNPLFIYGGVGLGKTHLIQAMGNQIFQNENKIKVRYISSDKFSSEFVSGLQNKTVEDFKNKHKELDVFIIDDVQFLTGREKIQEELFHIFNALYEKNKQIIFSSDRPPKAITGIMDRLRSRFEGGTVIDINFPDFETRLAILKAKAQEKNIELAPEIYEYIAKKIERNIRELEGALNRLILFHQANNQGLDLEKTKELLKDVIKPPLRIVNPRNVLQVVAEFYDLKEKDLLASSRKKELVQPRQIVMYLLKEELKCSFPFIGRKLGGKDHTTVMYGYRKIAQELKVNEKLKEEILLIKKRVFVS